MKPVFHRIQATQWQEWMGQWAELVQSGMPVLDALRLSAELQSTNWQGRLLQAQLEQTACFIEAGQSLHTAFRAACTTLPTPIEVSLVCAQANGDLGSALIEQLQRWQNTHAAKKALIKSLMYPALVLMMAVLCWVFLHSITSPHIKATDLHTGNGLLTSDAMLLTGLALLVAAGLFKVWMQQKASNEHFLLPSTAWQVSNFYHVIACELNAGLDLMHCLRYRPSSGHHMFGRLHPHHRRQNTLNQFAAGIQRNLKRGMSLTQAMQEAQGPQFLIRQCQLAEQTGRLAYCFHLAAKVYEMRAKTVQQRMQSILPPVALGLSALTLAMAYQFTLAPLYSNLTGLA